MTNENLSKIMKNRVVHWYHNFKISCFKKVPNLELINYTTDKKFVTCAFCLNKIKQEELREFRRQQELKASRIKMIRPKFNAEELYDDEVIDFKNEIRGMSEEKLKQRAEKLLKDFSLKKITLNNCGDMIKCLCKKLSFDNDKYLVMYQNRIENLQERIK